MNTAGIPDHAAEARAALERAERIANRDHYSGDRDRDRMLELAIAQVHATLAVAVELAGGMTVTAYSVQP